MKRFVVDYESYYSIKDGVSAGDTGVLNYVAQSYAYLVAIVGPGIKFVGSVEAAQKKFSNAFWESPQHEFWAANSNFDEAWTRRYWPGATKMRPWNCLLDQAAVAQLPRNLAGLAHAVKKTKVDKTLRDRMNGVHWKDLFVEEQKAMSDYCLQDALEEQELIPKVPAMSSVEAKVAAHTRMCNFRGVAVDQALMEADRQSLHEFKLNALRRIPWHADQQPLSHLALARWAGARGLKVPVSLAKDDEDCGNLMDLQPELAAVVGSMRQFRKANTLLEKLAAVEARVVQRQVPELPLELLYCGAPHTRRWSSRGVNIQNLDREPYWLTDEGKPADGAESVWTRRWIVPRPGKTFLVLDYSQVEPRCLNWLAGNDALLDMIRKGFGVYEAYARVAGLWKDPAPLKKTNPALYKSVKAQVLGLGYGMGASRYIEQAALDGITLSPEEADAVVKGWRRNNPGIVQLWASFDQDIVRAANGDGNLKIQMPSGEALSHFRVRATIKKTGFRIQSAYESYTVQGECSPKNRQGSLWGGVLTENVTQRMARDILAESILRLEAAGLPVVFHAHDEVILEVDDDESTRREALPAAMEIMKNAPEWAPDVPLDVEGGYESRYTK